ncbi:maleylacetate reductase [Kineococcus sp. SYSU DK003]|uniref:maleylacetate reductase n=1 Tax=Kineococcus sp. SYSU DK003 TaxID=3383124 RepID=UPI003D7D5554
MIQFLYQQQPMRVQFGAGWVDRVAEEVKALGLQKVLVLATPQQEDLAERVAASLGQLSAGVHAKAEMHVPIESARAARDLAVQLGADGCVAVGGGSTTGLGKAIALEYGLPIIAVPTTYAGSEMTPVWGLTADGVKKTGKDSKVLPRSVIYDPELTTTLPVSLSVTSGFNAIAHAVEGLYAPDGSPVVSLMAEGGIRDLLGALPTIVDDPSNLEARAQALQGAWLCGAVLGATTMSLHHKLCHTLGGTFNLPHAETHTVVLPYALAYNAPAIPAVMDTLRRLTGSDDPAKHLKDTSTGLGGPSSLSELGFGAGDIDKAVEIATQNAYANPREVTAAGIRQLLQDALTGAAPRSPEVG